MCLAVAPHACAHRQAAPPLVMLSTRLQPEAAVATKPEETSPIRLGAKCFSFIAKRINNCGKTGTRARSQTHTGDTFDLQVCCQTRDGPRQLGAPHANKPDPSLNPQAVWSPSPRSPRSPRSAISGSRGEDGPRSSGQTPTKGKDFRYHANFKMLSRGPGGYTEITTETFPTAAFQSEHLQRYTTGTTIQS